LDAIQDGLGVVDRLVVHPGLVLCSGSRISLQTGLAGRQIGLPCGGRCGTKIL
jgi:hypothetical protein